MAIRSPLLKALNECLLKNAFTSDTNDFLDDLDGGSRIHTTDRLRTVQLSIKLGKRPSLTNRQLGSPTKNALKTWHHEYEQHLDSPTGDARPPRYSQAHKQRAAEHSLAHGRCIVALIGARGWPWRERLRKRLRPARFRPQIAVQRRAKHLAVETNQDPLQAVPKPRQHARQLDR